MATNIERHVHRPPKNVFRQNMRLASLNILLIQFLFYILDIIK